MDPGPAQAFQDVRTQAASLVDEMTSGLANLEDMDNATADNAVEMIQFLSKLRAAWAEFNEGGF